jgi:hypothetical protein
MKGNDLTALCFTESSAVQAWLFVHDFSAVGSGYQSHQLQLVSSFFLHGAVYSYLRAMCIVVQHLHERVGSVGKNFDINSMTKDFPADKQFTQFCE